MSGWMQVGWFLDCLLHAVEETDSTIYPPLAPLPTNQRFFPRRKEYGDCAYTLFVILPSWGLSHHAVHTHHSRIISAAQPAPDDAALVAQRKMCRIPQAAHPKTYSSWLTPTRLRNKEMPCYCFTTSSNHIVLVCMSLTISITHSSFFFSAFAAHPWRGGVF